MLRLEDVNGSCESYKGGKRELVKKEIGSYSLNHQLSSYKSLGDAVVISKV